MPRAEGFLDAAARLAGRAGPVEAEPGGSLTAAQLAESLAGDPAGREAMRASFLQTPLHALLGLEILEVSRQRCVVQMPVREPAFNSTGNLHGGSLATLIDVAAATAAAVGSGFRPGVETLVTADLHVRYLGRPKTDSVRAIATVLRAGRQLIVVECRVLDGLDRVIAAADFSSMIVALREALRPMPTARPTDPDL